MTPNYSTLSPSARLFAREWDRCEIPIKLRYDHRLHKPGRYDITVDAIHPATGVVLMNGARWHSIYEHNVVTALGHRVVLHDYMALDYGQPDRARMLAPLATRLRLAVATTLDYLCECPIMSYRHKAPHRTLVPIKAEESDGAIRRLVMFAQARGIE